MEEEYDAAESVSSSKGSGLTDTKNDGGEQDEDMGANVLNPDEGTSKQAHQPSTNASQSKVTAEPMSVHEGEDPMDGPDPD